MLGAGWVVSGDNFLWAAPTLRRKATVFALPAFRFYYLGGPTAGVTGKGGTWREKPPDAESAVWSRDPESVGECPHLSGARGVGRF